MLAAEGLFEVVRVPPPALDLALRGLRMTGLDIAQALGMAPSSQ